MVASARFNTLLPRRSPARFAPHHNIAVCRGARAAIDLADASLRVLLTRHARHDAGLLSPGQQIDTSPEGRPAGDARCSLFILSTGARLLFSTVPGSGLTCVTLLRDTIPSRCPPSSVSHGPASLTDILPPSALIDSLPVTP